MFIAALLAAAGVSAAQTEPAPTLAPHPSDAEVAEWFKFRQTKFAELRAADPDQPAEIAAIKAATAAAVAAAGPLGAVDRPSVIWRTGKAPPVIYEDPAAPRMIVIPAGEFTMGPAPDEPGRLANEGPRHRVRIGYSFAVSLFPVVYGEYALFIADSHRAASGRCVTVEDGKAAARDGRDWRNTGYPQNVRYPAACISFADATAYAAWLSRKTGHRYRLLSEAEYEYVERAGTATAYWWGNDANAGCAFANGLDQAGKAANAAATPSTCNDTYAAAAPEGSLKPNAFGLSDVAGNVSSWTTDCWKGSYAGAPIDGSPNPKGDCAVRVLRGGSWASADLRSAARGRSLVGYVGVQHGFRLARDL